MPKPYLFIFFLLYTVQAAAQQPVLQWAAAFNANNLNNYTDFCNGRTMAVDAAGNVYSAGFFEHTVDFDPGPGVYTLTGGGFIGRAIYISKLSPSGAFMWAEQIPLSLDGGVIEMKLDHDDNIILVSDLEEAADMDPGPGVFMLTPIGPQDAFVIKLSGNGNFIWAKQFGGPGDTVPGSSAVAIDNDNNVITCGSFNNTVDFDPGPGIYNLTAPSVSTQAYMAKLSPNGDLIWAKQLGNPPTGNGGLVITDAECDTQGNIYAAGGYSGNCDFDPGSGTYMVPPTGDYAGYILKLDASANFIWAKSIQTAPNSIHYYSGARGLALDADNNVYTTGDFTGTVDFDPGPGTSMATTDNNTDWYLLKLDVNGNFKWVDIFHGSDADQGSDVAVDNSGNVYVTGIIGHSADMDPGPGVYTVTATYIYDCGALAKVNSNGGFIYALPFQSINYGTTLLRQMVVDAQKNIYITGYVSGTVDFDPSPAVYPLSGSSDFSPFVLKMSRCTNITSSTLNISTCNSYTLNNELFDSTGTYIITIPNSTGCDSIITLNLTVNKKFTSRAAAICEGQSFFAGGANQIVSGVYRDTLISSQNCDSIITTTLTVHPKPAPNLGADRNLCTGSEAVISPGSFTTYLWQDMSNGATLTVNSAGLYWVEVKDNFNCTSRDSLTVLSILPAPVNFLKEKDSICSYDKLKIVSLFAFPTYLWSTGATGNQIIADHAGMYSLGVTDANGCTGSDTIMVYNKKCISGLYFPNTFTPNKDGKNDVFKALVFSGISLFHLQIFDRAGQLIFETTDPAKGWDGTYKAATYSTGVFVWQCFYQLAGQAAGYQQGTVLVVR